MVSFSTLVIIVSLYFMAMLIMAETAEKNNLIKKFTEHPTIYILSLTVYCSTWSYYGSLGLASKSGILFLTVYLGPVFGAFLWPHLIGKLIQIRNRYGVTTLADLLVVRYGKSANLGALVATFILIAFIPYVALQIKSITSTTSLLIDHSTWTESHASIFELLFMGAITIFTIMFGLRKIDYTERHPGMIFSLAIEGVIKIITFVIPAVTVIYYLNGNMDTLIQRLKETPASSHLGQSTPKDLIDFIVYTIVSANAFLFLPRQFHVMVIENKSYKHIFKAQWLVPLYMFCFTLLVLPLAISGNYFGYQGDEFMLLTIPQKELKSTLLTLFVYIGGISAGIGMITICTMAISTMVSNHMLLKFVHDFNRFDRIKGQILKARWLIAFIIVFSAYYYQKIIGTSIALVSMGMISFVAIFQIAPAIFFGLFWKRANKIGALTGIISGIVIWAYTLFIPAFAKSNFIIPPSFITNGPLNILWLKPEALFRLEGLSSISHATIWSLFFNVSAIVLCSYLFKVKKEDSEYTFREEFFDLFSKNSFFQESSINSEKIDITHKLIQGRILLADYLGHPESLQKIKVIREHLDIDDANCISFIRLIEFRNLIESELAGAIGTSAAHIAIVKSHIISKEEETKLSHNYATILASLNISPTELQSKVDFYVERERLFLKQAEELTRLLGKRDKENEQKNREIIIANENLNKKNRELEKSLLEIRDLQQKIIYSNRMSSLGAMASGISHEINTPLNVITLGTEILIDLLSQPDPNLELIRVQLTNIIETAKRIGSIVKGLKSFAREDIASPLENTPLQDIVRDTLALCQKKVESRGCQLTSDIPEGLMTFCRPVQIVQVLMNLIGNALDATNSSNERWIKLSATQETDHIKLLVTDSGKGIPLHIVEKMMEPFFTTKAVGSGTGLGLSISLGIIQDQGGKLYYNSDAPNTEFIIEIQNATGKKLA